MQIVITGLEKLFGIMTFSILVFMGDNIFNSRNREKIQEFFPLLLLKVQLTLTVEENSTTLDEWMTEEIKMNKLPHFDYY